MAVLEAPKPSPERNDKGQFILGGIGIGGRPKGSRNQLGEAFIEDLYAHWKENGKDAIETLYAKFPADYVKVIASILPRDLNVKVSLAESMTDDEIDAAIERYAARDDAARAHRILGVTN